MVRAVYFQGILIKTTLTVHVIHVLYLPLGSASSHLLLHISFSLLTERLQEPSSHSCDLHPKQGPVSAVKVGRAKATCVLHAGLPLRMLSLVTVYTCKKKKGGGEGAGQGQKSECTAVVVVTLVIS